MANNPLLFDNIIKCNNIFINVILLINFHKLLLMNRSIIKKVVQFK